MSAGPLARQPASDCQLSMSKAGKQPKGNSRSAFRPNAIGFQQHIRRDMVRAVRYAIIFAVSLVLHDDSVSLYGQRELS